MRRPSERPPFTIREATSEDASAILDCLREAFAPYRSRYTEKAFADTVLTPQTLAQRCAAMTVFAAFAGNGALAGTIGAGVEENHDGHLRGMAVRAAWQGSGLAAGLLAAAESLLLARGCRRVTLDTTGPLTRAIAFYRRHGYAPTGRTQDFYGMPLHEYAKGLHT
jgi:ribosomal protein S18 acetylase RimI-like enzyme